MKKTSLSGLIAALALVVLCVFLMGCGRTPAPPSPAAAPTSAPVKMVSASLDTAFVRASSNSTHAEAIVHTSMTLPAIENVLQPAPTAKRPPVEGFSLLYRTSRFGAPYDELYLFQFDSALWQPLVSFEENQWLVQEISTIKAPGCTIQSRVSKAESVDAGSLKALENRYQRMGAYVTGQLTFDVFSYTSDLESLADTQNVVYILTAANGDQPYLIKPQYLAFSAYNDWDQCRALVRSALSTLVMKRVPVVKTQ